MREEELRVSTVWTLACSLFHFSARALLLVFSSFYIGSDSLYSANGFASILASAVRRCQGCAISSQLFWETNMKLKKKLGSGFETLETRVAPSTLLGAGILLDPAWGKSGKFDTPSDEVLQAVSVLIGSRTSASSGQANIESLAEQSAKSTHDVSKVVLDAFDAKGSPASASQLADIASVSKDTAQVFNFPTGDQLIEGASSTLRRTPNGISWTFKTNGLQPGHAYTVWVVVFNNPEACVGGCGLDDLARPGVDATLAYGGGHVVGPSGEATFSGHLQVGDTSGFPLDSPFVGLPGQHLGLVDAYKADIHLVIRDHGEVIPGQLSEQLHTFSGGSGVNTLANVQFAAHHA
jgi:hypothetical protein